jgi:ABC-type lipoprotein export system ATPase subunit
VVTHNPDLAASYARRVVRLVDGQVASDAIAGAGR